MKTFIAILFITSMAHLECSGQDPYYINYTIDDGLPSNEVYDVEIDNEGILWFTTDRGVCTYDSYQFTTYTTYDGLGDNVNFEIFKDSKGTLWFFGYNGKITFYRDGKFVLYDYNKELYALMSSVVGTHIKEVAEGKNDTIYLSCDTHFGHHYITLKENTRPTNKTLPETNSIIKVDSFHFLYKKSNYHIKAKRPIFFESKNQSLVSFINSESNINFIYEDIHKLWFSTILEQGIQSISKIDKSITLLFKDFEITNIRKDYNEGYWITTRNNGILNVPNMNINLINPNKSKSKKVKLLRFEKLGNKLLCGTSGSSIFEISDDNSIQEYSTSKYNTRHDIDHFQSMNNGKTIHSTGFQLEYKGEKILFRKTQNTRENIVASNKDIISKSLRQYIVYSANNREYYSTSNKITTIIEDNNKKIWIGTLDGLLCIDSFDYSNPFNITSNEGKSLGRISDIIVDAKSNIWVCTIGNGIFVISNQKIKQFNSDNGLISNIVNTLEVTPQNEVWVATNKGLNLLKYKNTLEDLIFIEAFDQSDGLNSGYINDVYKWNDKIYVASPNGICYFKSQHISKPRPETPLIIKSILINDKSSDMDSLMHLQYNQNKVSIQYTAIRYNKTNDQIIYRYKLSKNGRANAWNYTNDREVVFENLKEGMYTFEVNSVNKFGEWNESSEIVSFKIDAHFTDKLWFRVLVFLLSLLTITLIIIFFVRRYQQLKATELALEEARTRAKEAELSALRNQMNPHFIFNSLNTIQNFVFKKDVTKANYLLSKFSSLIRRSLNYSRLEAITISEEIQFLNDYIELEKVRFPNFIKANFIIDETLNISSDRISSLLLQPLVENSIKHGISKSKEPGEIIISIKSLNTEYLTITISDTGHGMEKSDNKGTHHVSLGHQIVKDRIDVLKSKGYPKASFSVNNHTSLPNIGYEVNLILPIL